jgi:hypothetical protein
MSRRRVDVFDFGTAFENPLKNEVSGGADCDKTDDNQKNYPIGRERINGHRTRQLRVE